MNNLLKKLNEPFPEDTSLRNNLLSVIGIGVFVTLFLYLIQPFDLHLYPKDPLGICIGFGLVTIFASLLFEFFTMYVLRIQKDVPSWTLWKWIVNAIFLIGFISICNYLYMTILMGWGSLNWQRFGFMIFSTLVVGIFPVVFSGMMIQINAYKRNQVQAESIQSNLAATIQKEQLINLTSQNNNQTLQVAVANLFYLEAQQNYVSICHLKEGEIEKTVFRNTIKQMEAQLESTSLFRCHRSFMVNTELIENVAGNAQGLRLSLTNLPDFEVPVSRKYIPALKTLIS